MSNQERTMWYWPRGFGTPKKCVVIGPETLPSGKETGMVAVDFCKSCKRTVTLVETKDLWATETGAYQALADYNYDSREEERLSQL